MHPLEIKNGSFFREGKKILPTGPVYFGRSPGSCGGDWFGPDFWPANEARMDRDFALMRQVGFTWAVPFIDMGRFFKDGKPLEDMFARVTRMVELARKNDFYLILFPGLHCMDNGEAAMHVLGRKNPEPRGMTFNQMPFSSYLYEAQVTAFSEFSVRYGKDPAVPLLMGRSGGRLWTAYAGFRPGEPEAAELAPIKPFWQKWLQERYRDDFGAYLRTNPHLPERPKTWSDISLPTEVVGQFTPADSRTFDFLTFQATTLAITNARFHADVKKRAPWIRTMSVHEGCEFNTGPQENYIPGLGTYDAVWIEMYGFNMANGSTLAPDWQRVGFVEPTTGKDQIYSLSVFTEAWERCRYFKAAAPNTALIPCHGSVLHAFLRWARTERDQRILYERLQRVYQEAGADGMGFWCWSDDESSARSEPEFFHREGESMGVIDMHDQYRPVARRMRTYLAARAIEPRVSDDVLLLVPTAHRLGLSMIDSNMTTACLTSGLARLGIQPEVKHTWFRGRGPIARTELDSFKVIIVAADEYTRDFPEIPDRLLGDVRNGGRVLLAMSDLGSSLIDPYGVKHDNPALAELLGTPEIQSTYHQQWNPWTVSLRWQLRNDFIPYWDQRRGRYLPGRREKALTYKWIAAIKDAQILAEAVAPSPYKGDDPTELNKYFIQQQKMGPWSPLLYKRSIGSGEVYVFLYSLNVFRAWLDEIDHQHSDWDWVLQGPLDAARVTTDPTAALSVLAQEFLNFRGES